MDSSDQKLNSIYRFMVRMLSQAGIETAEKEARLILSRRTGLGLDDLLSKPDTVVSKQQVSMIHEDIRQRIAGKPISRIYGEQEFWGLPFLLSPETLDPRADTEIIIDIAKQRFYKNSPETILDLGTGSGCILTALLTEFKNAHGMGVDLSHGAAKIAQENLKRNNCTNRAFVICGSWTSAIDKKFDLVVSNPPYITNQIIGTLAPEVQNHDPILALDGGEDGLQAYREIFSSLKKVLNSTGLGLFEIGYDQGKSVSRLAEEHGFSVLGVHPDLAGQPRVVEISCGDK